MEGIILAVVIGIILFLVLREFWCWYWKINEIRDLMKQILAELKKRPDEYICDKCGAAVSKDAKVCRKCGNDASDIT